MYLMELMKRIRSPILFEGTDTTAYRDPTAIYAKGQWHLFFTLVERLADGNPYLTLAKSTSSDLICWTPVRRLTPYDRSLNYSSPGNILETDDGQHVICFQTYCRENDEKYGNARSRLYTMTSPDLENWSEPELLRVKGDVPVEDMGRMIDPYLIRTKDQWWCFYKQNGVSFSTSPDMRHWTFRGHIDGGENVCVLPAEDGYRMFHSPQNGIGVKKSQDLLHWTDEGKIITLGQKNWPWAQGRLTAAFVIDARSIPNSPPYVMFFHGSGPEDETVYFDDHASIGLAWSSDLQHWYWADEVPFSSKE